MMKGESLESMWQGWLHDDDACDDLKNRSACELGWKEVGVHVS